MLIGIGIGAFLILNFVQLAPNLTAYVPIAKFISIAVILLSTFCFGAASARYVYEEKNTENTHTVEVGAQHSKDANEKIGGDLDNKQAEVQIKTVYVTKYIHDHIDDINHQCVDIGDTAWTAYNQAVVGEVK
ncbi:MAG TPA: hypothetical protein VFM18_18525 [Methanosarcina sp.]|nr:hypothetical protein [Methanosarcina sp.]